MAMASSAMPTADDLFRWDNVTVPYRQALKKSLKHLVSAHPGVLQDSNADSAGGGSGGCGSILTVVEPHRVVVYSAPGGPDEDPSLTVHACFSLPSPVIVGDGSSANVIDVAAPSLAVTAGIDLAWTRFQPRNDSPASQDPPVLCVLVQSVLYIWNVYPASTVATIIATTNRLGNADGGDGETCQNRETSGGTSAAGATMIKAASSTAGASSTWKHDASWTVSLPFVGAAIYPLPDGKGLLICRQPDYDEQRLLQEGEQVAVVDDDVEGEDPGMMPWTMVLPSVYSLSHPLEDVIPVMELVLPPAGTAATTATTPASALTAGGPIGHANDGKNLYCQHHHQRPWLEALETVVWVGGAVPKAEDGMSSSSVSSSPSSSSSLLCVTYHAVQRRHTIWSLQPAPSPSPPLPLHQQLKSRVPNPSDDPITSGSRAGGASAAGALTPRHPDYPYYPHHSFHPQNEGAGMVGAQDPASARGNGGAGVGRQQPVLLPLDDPAMPPSSHHHHNLYPVNTTSTRDEALADALGVSRRLSPRPTQASSAAVLTQSHHFHHPSHRASIGASTTASATAGVVGSHPPALSGFGAAAEYSLYSPRQHPLESSAMTASTSATPSTSSVMFSPPPTLDGPSGGGGYSYSTMAPFAATPTSMLQPHWAATVLHREPPASLTADYDLESEEWDATDHCRRIVTVPHYGSISSSSSSSSSPPHPTRLLGLLHRRTLRLFRVWSSSQSLPPNAAPAQPRTVGVSPWEEATLHPCHDVIAVRDWLLVLGGDPKMTDAFALEPAARTHRSSLSSHDKWWTLFSGPYPIVSSRLPRVAREDNSKEKVDVLSQGDWQCLNTVHDRVTLRYSRRGRNIPLADDDNKNDMASYYWNVCISLRPRSSPLAERVLDALQAALEDPRLENDHLDERSAFVSAIRADVCRVEEAMKDAACASDEDNQMLPLCDELGFAALYAVLMTLMEHELLGSSSFNKVLAKTLPATRAADNAWSLLLSSDFHRSYVQSHEDKIFLGGVDAQSRPVDSVEVGASRARRILGDIGSLSLNHLRKHGSKNRFVPVVFESVHLLYEEVKLCSSSSRFDLEKLGGLLLKIVATASSDAERVSNFIHYYHGDTLIQMDRQVSPTLGASVQLRSITKFDEPPSILVWVDRLMKGESTQTNLFDEPNKINPTCRKLRSIVRIFKRLFSADTSGDRDLHVIRTLLEEGFIEARTIEDLAPGIALPILELLFRCRNDPSLAGLSGWSSEACHLIGREDLSKNLSPRSSQSAYLGAAGDNNGHNGADTDNDGLVQMEISSAMFFPRDNRVHEVARLLRSSRAIFLRVHRPVEASDHDYERLKQKRLSVLGSRTLSLPVGRGMFTIGSIRPVEAERLPIPELCLKGRAPTTNAILALDESESPTDFRVWPEFHNGVAAGLRLPASYDSSPKLTRTWILYNRPPPNPPSPPSEDEANPIQHRQGHLHAGFLLALGLRGHLTSLEMSDIYEYLTQGSVTTTVGVLLGMAANKRGSCDISVSKMLCLHIPSLIPQHFSAIDVASTVQASAVIGCGLLFQRSSHRMMTEFLLNEIGRRPESDANAYDRDSYTLSCGLALGMVNLAIADKSEGNRGAGIADLRVEERLYRYMVGGVDNEEARRRREANDRFSVPSASLTGENEKCCTIYEGDLINTSITAPAAILALALMYMKSGNRTIAASLSVPDTHFLLEFVRPDFLGLRLVAKALILWDEVEPSIEWIDRQIPTVVKTAYQEMRTIAKGAMEGNVSEKPHDPEYDRRAIRQIHAHLVAGACFGMGLRFAGTFNRGAKEALSRRVSELEELRRGTDPVSIASRPDDPILETCLCTAAISLALVMAGSGDLDTLRLLKMIRWRCEEQSKYGHHMMYGMAIGLLFLGGGTFTVGRSPEDLAALITAFYPRFPVTTSDNEYHLQALRHLYALAVKRQDILAVDIDTNELVALPVRVHKAGCNSSPKIFSVPFLLPNSDVAYDELEVFTPEYFPLRVNLRSRQGGFVFYVKRSSTILSSSLSPAVDGTLPLSPTSNPFLQAVGRYLTRTSDSPFTFRFLQECIVQDSPEALPLYFSLVDRSPMGAFFWDLRLFRTYYQNRNRFLSDRAMACQPLLLDSDLLLPCLSELAERRLLELDREGKDITNLAACSYGT